MVHFQVFSALSNVVDDEAVKVELLQMAARPVIECVHGVEWYFV